MTLDTVVWTNIVIWLIYGQKFKVWTSVWAFGSMIGFYQEKLLLLCLKSTLNWLWLWIYFGQKWVFYFSVWTQTWRTFLFEKRTFFRKCLFNITIESSLESNNFPLVEMMGLTWKCSLTPQHTLSKDWEFELFKAWEIETQKGNFYTLRITSFSTDSIVCE